MLPAHVVLATQLVTLRRDPISRCTLIPVLFSRASLSCAQVNVSVLSMLRGHGGRVLQAKWKPPGGDIGLSRRGGGGGGGFSRPAFLTSSTDCTVMLWSLTRGTATPTADAAARTS